MPALAAVGFVAATAWYLGRGDSAGYAVEALDGAPTIANAPLGANGRLRPGERLVTDGASRARVRVGGIGFAEIEPGSRLRLVRTGGEEHRLALERGALHAVIVAPPRRFFVETPSATAVDLGCAYRLEVDAAGRGLVRVTSGWVSFEWRGHEAFIPAGSGCETRPGAGPGTPWRDEAPERWRAALAAVDFEGDRGAALDTVLAGASRADALTLWHLLARLTGGARARVVDRLALLAPIPAGVTRAAILEGDRRALDRWWEALGYGDVEWWRMWQRSWGEPRS